VCHTYFVAFTTKSFRYWIRVQHRLQPESRKTEKDWIPDQACPVLRYGVRDDRFAIKVLIVTDI
ncbi:MAG: hypothetical protein ACOCZ2_02610, partial [Thermodesulfobacteriota bacterium]